MAMPRSPLFDNVDPALLALIQKTAAGYAPYKAGITSAYRPGDPRFHGRGRALDVELTDPKTGAVLKNYQDPSTAAAYQNFANAVYQAADPEMQKRLRWGGYFREGGPGTYGALDLMHFDTGGDTTPMAGGSWAGGFSPEQMKLWGIQNAGGLQGSAPTGAPQQGPAMPNAPVNYTPEQRRNAIAAIESAGSGDYNALGAWTGDPEQGRDRAYGRYQMMGANIPKWSQEVLGRTMTPRELLADPKAQDAIFDKVFGDYVQKYGEQGAASMWFTGRPDAPGVSDVNGMSGPNYVQKYMAGLGAPGVTGAAYPSQVTKPTPPALPGDPTKAPENKGFDIMQAMSDIGADFSGSNNTSTVPRVQMAKPMATPTQPQLAPSISVQGAQASRDQLAQALARLNAGRLFVG